MVEKIKTEEPMCKTVVELTPDDLMTAARKLQLMAAKAQPGQEILLNFTSTIVLKYDPKISQTASDLRNAGRELPGTKISSILDAAIQNQVEKDNGIASH